MLKNHSRLAIIAIIAAVLASVAYLFFTREADTSSIDTEPQQRQTQSQPDTSPPPDRGTYTAYSADKLSSTKGTKLLFFHAPWCPQCRELEASIDTTGVPKGVTIFKVDYDSSQSLRLKYGVTIQTTVVKIDDEGNKVASFVAYEDPSIDALRQALLQ